MFNKKWKNEKGRKWKDMKVPKVITSWENSRRQTVSNVKNIKRKKYKIHSKRFLD
jgi:hypothetical protein